MLVHQLLEKAAESYPDKTALVANGREWSYGALESASNRFAHTLLGLGVRRGDRIAVHLPNCAEAVIAIFGILKAGAAFVVLNKSTKPDKLAYILNHAGAAGLVSAQAGEPLAAAAAAVPSLRFIFTTSARAVEGRSGDAALLLFPTVGDAASASRPRVNMIDLELACLVYTSGSTGEPRGVMTDHSNMVFVTGSINRYLGNTPDDRILSVLPLSFVYGMYQLMIAVEAGATLILEDSLVYPALVLGKIKAHRATGFPGVPGLFALLLRADLKAFDLSSLRYLTNAGGPMPTPHIVELRRHLPRVSFFSMYGLTEAKSVLYLPPEEIDARPDSVGIPIPGTEVWLEDAQGARQGPGKVGELIVRGRHVMRGYWGAPEETERRFRPGPLPGERVCHTGDLFRMDRDGYFYFVARQDDIIKSRGRKVAPKEVEDVLCAIAGVAEAAIVGVPDPLLGEAIKAFIVLKPGYRLTPGEVIAQCRARLEDFKAPKFVEFREELPKSEAGKIARRELKKCVESPVYLTSAAPRGHSLTA